MAKATGNTFAVGILELDPGPLVAQIQNAENTFTNSVQVMQVEADLAASKMTQAMARVPPSINLISTSSLDAGRAMSGMANTATLLGGTMGVVVSQGIAAVETFRNLAIALGPLGLLAAVLSLSVAVGFKLAGAWRNAKEAAQATSKATTEFLEAAAKKSEKLAKIFDTAVLQIRAKGGSQQAAAELVRREREATGINPAQIDFLEGLEKEARLNKELARQERERGTFREETAATLQGLENEKRRMLGLGIERGFEAPAVVAKRAEVKALSEQLALEKEIAEQKSAQFALQVDQVKSEQDHVTSISRNLAVRLGFAVQSEFEENPIIRRLLEIGETLDAPGATTPRLQAGGLRGARIGPGVQIATQIGERRENEKMRILARLDGNVETFIRNQAGMGS